MILCEHQPRDLLYSIRVAMTCVFFSTKSTFQDTKSTNLWGILTNRYGVRLSWPLQRWKTWELHLPSQPNFESWRHEKKNDMTWLNKLHPKDLIDFSGNLDECHVCRKSMLPRSLDKRRSETTTFSVILKAFAPQIPRSSPRDFRDVLTSSHLISHSIHWLAIPSKPHSQSNFDPWQLARSQCWQGSKCETMSMAKWQVRWTSSLTGWWCLLILGIKSEAAKTPPFLGKIISPRKNQGHFEWIIPFPVKWGTVGEPWSNCRTCFTVFLLLIQPTPTLYLGWIALRM